MADHQLDARNLICPLPVLKTKKALRDIPAGATLEVLATDPNTPADMKAFVAARGHTLVSETETDGVFALVVQKSG
jgi:tRNA 2-thiouridine synthesizing protein A